MVDVSVDFIHHVESFRGNKTKSIRVFEKLDGRMKDFNIEVVVTKHSVALLFVDRKAHNNKDVLLYFGLADDSESLNDIEQDMEDLHKLGIELQKFMRKKDDKVYLDIERDKDWNYVFTLSGSDPIMKEKSKYVFKDMYIFYGQQKIETSPFYSNPNLRIPSLSV